MEEPIRPGEAEEIIVHMAAGRLGVDQYFRAQREATQESLNFDFDGRSIPASAAGGTSGCARCGCSRCALPASIRKRVFTWQLSRVAVCCAVSSCATSRILVFIPFNTDFVNIL